MTTDADGVSRREFIGCVGGLMALQTGVLSAATSETSSTAASLTTQTQTISRSDASTKGFSEQSHDVDLCVVGGGMAGVCAAIAAARSGIKVALMHERPVLGGNSSSECRVHICGADRHNHFKNMRETGILEELRMENLYRNPNRNFSVWDAVLYDKVVSEPNITLLLNCSCLDAAMKGETIQSVTGWQLTSQTRHRVAARIFADCSGDGVLAPLTGAQFRIGREARAEFNESISPVTADSRTMGMTCLFQARDFGTPQAFEPPAWARTFELCSDISHGANGHRWLEMGYWWVELGGEYDSIHDTEKLRHELLKITFGMWDHIKNRCPNRKAAENWGLEWIQFLPAKRESRRYVGAHVLTQGDVEAEGKFDDVVAYGGWSMDDHHPAGFESIKVKAPATIFHPAPSPYGIPYRCLYSRNVRNLMFAGRTASCTHAAMSSSRVMGTASVMGQAVGTAAAMAVKAGVDPAGVGTQIKALQQKLLCDDAYLPWVPQQFGDLTMRSKLEASAGVPEPVRDGVNRPVGEDAHCWPCKENDWIAYTFDKPTNVQEVAVVVDSGLDQIVAMSYHQKDNQLTRPPGVMPMSFRIEGLVDGQWQEVARQEKNRRRQCRFQINKSLGGVRFVLEKTWGAPESRVYAFSVS